MRYCLSNKAPVYSDILWAAGMLSLSVFIPFAVHGILSSWGGVVWGARLLPLYYMPLAAVIFLRLPFALALGLCSPMLNHVITHYPARDKILPVSGELLLFTAGVYAVVHYRRSYLIPLVCIAAKTVIFLLFQFPVPGKSGILFYSLAQALPGLGILWGWGVWLHAHQARAA